MDGNVSVRRAGSVAVAVPHGEYDIANVSTLRAELVDILRSRPTGIVVDLSDVEFCDLACLRSMAGIGNRAAAVGVWVRIAAPSPLIRRLLEITGLSVSLPAYPDVEQALRGPRNRLGAQPGRAASERVDAEGRDPGRAKTMRAATTWTEA